MLDRLANHPFAVDAHFDRSIVLAFAVPPAALRDRVPAVLALDTLDKPDGRHAFLAVAIVRTRELRPAGFPRALGRSFSLVGYRVFVRYRTSAGRALRGLYILRTETDSPAMVRMGNLFTRYGYRRTDVAWEVGPSSIAIRSEGSALDVEVERSPSGEPPVEPPMPDRSPFAGWREARRYAGPLPFTFSPTADGRHMILIEGVRSNWTPRPLSVRRARVGFFERQGLPEARLANAFLVEDVPYRWKRGVADPLPALGPSP